jgi:DNA-binding GntR family transcriptional regulator
MRGWSNDDLLTTLGPWQRIYVALRSMILSGELAPGTRLVELDLADRFKTSRGPVRSALKELDHRGLVIIKPGRGAFVRSFSRRDVEESLSLWELIWGFAVRRAVERMQPADLERLKAVTEDVTTSDDPELNLEWGIRNRRIIFEIADHHAALAIFDGLVSQAQSRLLMLVVAGHYMDTRPADEESELYDALARGDVDRATEIGCRWSRQLHAFLLDHAHDLPFLSD